MVRLQLPAAAMLIQPSVAAKSVVAAAAMCALLG